MIDRGREGGREVGRRMMVRLMPYGVRECKQACSNRWIRGRDRDIKQEKKGRTIV
jgi:hypothetical protein